MHHQPFLGGGGAGAHRLSLDESLPPQEADVTIVCSGATSRQAMGRDELLKTGVQVKDGAVLRFAEREMLPSPKTIHASQLSQDQLKDTVV